MNTFQNKCQLPVHILFSLTSTSNETEVFSSPLYPSLKCNAEIFFHTEFNSIRDLHFC